MVRALPTNTECFTTETTQRLQGRPSRILTREGPCFSVVQPRNSFAISQFEVLLCSQCKFLVTPKSCEGVTSLLHTQRSAVLKLQECSLANKTIDTLTPYCVLWFCLCCSAHPVPLVPLTIQPQTVSNSRWVFYTGSIHPTGFYSACPSTAVLLLWGLLSSFTELTMISEQKSSLYFWQKTVFRIGTEKCKQTYYRGYLLGNKYWKY